MRDDKLWEAFSLFIRARDVVTFDGTGVGRCFTCGALTHWKKGDCGHGVPRQHMATKYNEQNNHLQCTNCNWSEGGAREAYKKKMDEVYGAGTWDKMVVASRGLKKFTAWEIDLWTKFYREKLKEIKVLKKL